MSEALLEIQDLQAHFFVGSRVIRAVQGVSFRILPGEIVGLAGESGCGKSVTTQCILRMLPHPGRMVTGRILFRGQDLALKTAEEMRRIRGKHISIVAQDALAALNPVISTGEQVADVFRAHTNVSRKAAWRQAVEMFQKVRIPNAELMATRYPHEFSGGMQQRTVIAGALVCGPDLIIADEPTTALDVTVQLQILDLLRQARDELGSGILYISHDLSVVAQICDRVMVMYAGEIVEQAPTAVLFGDPKHPYTQGLLKSIPPLVGEGSRYLSAIPGAPPDLSQYVDGCRFAERCTRVMDVCRHRSPKMVDVGADRRVRCLLYESGYDL